MPIFEFHEIFKKIFHTKMFIKVQTYLDQNESIMITITKFQTSHRKNRSTNSIPTPTPSLEILNVLQTGTKCLATTSNASVGSATPAAGLFGPAPSSRATTSGSRLRSRIASVSVSSSSISNSRVSVTRPPTFLALRRPS